eukprot:scaffold22592_cov129-Cylindrotheca_fusiformis.AAC.33
MSQVYSTEPQTSGRVIFETTHGPLEVQLWCRECPATTRLFLQLCLDGYYDKMLFHRIVPNFLIQTGAIRHGKGNQHDALGNHKDMEVYRERLSADDALTRRSYELNSRIRFNHRGQVAMALEASDNDDSALLQPQFFITLDEASFLDGKHVVFGTISGPTIFNCLRIGKTDVDEETNQPTELSEAPRIERVKIMENEVHTDIVPTEEVPWMNSYKKDATKKKKKRKGVKNVNVLSFGDEFETESSGGTGIKSSHDLIESKTLVREVDEGVKQASALDDMPAVLSTKRRREKDSKEQTNVPKAQNEQLGSMVPIGKATKGLPGKVTPLSGMDPIPDSEDTGGAHGINAPEKAEKKMSLVAARRAKYAKGASKSKRKREEDTLAKLQLFQTKVVKNSGEDEKGVNAKYDLGYQGLEDGDDGSGNWLKTKFRCRKHMDIDAKLGGDGRNAMEDYEIVDGKGSNKHYKSRHLDS